MSDSVVGSFVNSTLVKPLSHEWQLGSELNESVRAGEADKFRLLLAMLSEDVQDQAQFDKLPRDESQAVDHRKQFELPPEQNHYAQDEELQNGEAAKLALAEDRMALLLKNCLHPEPLSAPEVKGPGYEVMNTLSPLQQYKQRVAFGLAEPQEPEQSWLQADQALLNMLNQQKLVA